MHSMKRYLLTLSITGVLLSSIIGASATRPVSAHELLPKNVIMYIQTHPDASPQQIEDYIKTSSPGLSKKVKSQQDVIRIVQQKTSLVDNSLDFIKLGVKHILSGPDHILFVLSLLLVFLGIRNVLRYTGTFTVAHSITLILAGSGILTLSSRIVEPVIALSIAVVALATVFLQRNAYISNLKSKLGIVFFFGLFHGLGFAGLLKEIQIPQDKFLSSLFSFNIGIEIGQLIIVAAALPFIYAFRNKKYYPSAIQIIAVVIAAIALFWMVQRIAAGFAA